MGEIAVYPELTSAYADDLLPLIRGVRTKERLGCPCCSEFSEVVQHLCRSRRAIECAGDDSMGQCWLETAVRIMNACRSRAAP